MKLTIILLSRSIIPWVVFLSVTLFLVRIHEMPALLGPGIGLLLAWSFKARLTETLERYGSC